MVVISYFSRYIHRSYVCTIDMSCSRVGISHTEHGPASSSQPCLRFCNQPPNPPTNFQQSGVSVFFIVTTAWYPVGTGIVIIIIPATEWYSTGAFVFQFTMMLAEIFCYNAEWISFYPVWETSCEWEMGQTGLFFRKCTLKAEKVQFLLNNSESFEMP